MGEVRSLVPYFPMSFSYGLYRFLSAVRSVLLAGYSLLQFGELIFCSAKMARVVDECAVRECSKVGDAQIDADVFVAGWQWF